MSRKLLLLHFMLSALLAPACQLPTSVSTANQRTDIGPLVWPQPPLAPRLRFVKRVAGPSDLGIEPSFFKRLVEIIAGRREEWFVRPNGVVSDGEIFYVADPGAQALWIFNSNAGRFHKIQEAGGQTLISPVAVARGLRNRVYVADSYLAKVFIYDSDGKLSGKIEVPDLRRPAGLAYDGARDRLYVADSAAHRIWIFAGEGKLLGVIGRRGTGNGEFNFPTHVAVDHAGTLYVTDALNFRLQMFNDDGSFSGLFGRHGDSSGEFASPKGVAVDSEGHIYVVDALFDAVQIFDRNGQYLLTFGERGLGLGQFWLPAGIFIDGRNQIYVADAYNQRIQIFQYLKGGSGG